ncbi:MAG: hypothetical protein ACRDXB_04555 [Actinomycetes bacterium]
MRKISFVGILLALFGVFLVPLPTASAGDDGCAYCEVDQTGDNAGATNQVPENGSDGGDPGTDGVDYSGPVYNGPFKEYRYVVNCMYNGPNNPGDALCMAAVSSCPAEDEIRYRVYYRLVDRQGRLVDGSGWNYEGSECRGPDDPTGVVQPQVTEEMVVAEAERTAPEPTVHVEPATKSYVNVPNNFYADAEDATHTVNLLGASITIAFLVEDVRWEFGDGAGATGAGVRNASVGAPGTVEHQYARGGGYDITATTSLTVQFTLPGGQQITLPNAISQTSAPVTLQVGEIQTTVNNVG